MLIEPNHEQLSVRQQCELLDLNRSTLYYQKQAPKAEKLALMKAVDEGYTKYPFYGTRRMKVYLRTKGFEVNRKQLQKIYKTLGLETVYPKPKLKKDNQAHKIYPYLLKGVAIERVHQVYSTDIT